ncbi:hypothetical protein KDY119_01386 [Luteimicrobium xylanilyticum]|uniref:Uncharacterized protein n=1 Tax=Luteimicrobium xylanilyticum TaxID=1133546 RepID=A0A5P9Q9S1_9MICO|nr:hypothetical protein [Luteimicrobium xylanilyticum]QFU97880.1 hypothetical protein KDY119_01386 [Luteimicrobium xylanilyticum]
MGAHTLAMCRCGHVLRLHAERWWIGPGEHCHATGCTCDDFEEAQA